MIKKKGGAGFAVGLAIHEVIDAIALDRRRLLPVSSVQNGCYGIRDVALSVPTVVGRAGVVATHEIELVAEGSAGIDGRVRKVLRQTIDTVLSADQRIAAKCKNLSTRNSPPSTPTRRAAKDFILADAKDADMAFGIGAPGLSPEAHAGEVRFRTLAEYREQIRQIVEQGLVDIMLMSASTNDVLAHQERLFDNSHVTPAARANDTTDIFVVRGNQYIAKPSRPFRTAPLDHIQCGHLDCSADRARSRRQPRPVQHHVQQPARRRPADARAVSAVPRRGRAQGLSPLSRSLRSERAACDLAPDKLPAFINDQHRPHAGRRGRTPAGRSS